MINIKESELYDIIDNTNIVLVLLYQDGCFPCIRQKEVIEYSENLLPLTVAMNAADNLDYNDYLDPPGYPCQILYIDGLLIKKNVGLLEKKELLEFIKDSELNYE